MSWLLIEIENISNKLESTVHIVYGLYMCMAKYVASEKILVLLLCACEFDVIVTVFLFAHKKKKIARQRSFFCVAFFGVLIVTASNINDFMLQAVSCYARTSTQ